MRENFKLHGELAPIYFIITDGRLKIDVIPSENLETSEAKESLGRTFKVMCRNPKVSCFGTIIDAYVTTTDQNAEITKLLLSGAMKVAELKDKHDAMVLTIATPEEELVVMYLTDPKTRTILKRIEYQSSEDKTANGNFMNFFELRNKPTNK